MISKIIVIEKSEKRHLYACRNQLFCICQNIPRNKHFLGFRFLDVGSHFSQKTFLVFPGFFIDISFLVIESDLLFVESYL